MLGLQTNNKMSLITVSAIVNADASFAFRPYGLPENKSISVNPVASVEGMYQVSLSGRDHSQPTGRGNILLFFFR